MKEEWWMKEDGLRYSTVGVCRTLNGLAHIFFISPSLPPFLLTTTANTSDTRKGPRDVIIDVSWATGMFFLSDLKKNLLSTFSDTIYPFRQLLPNSMTTA
jgi:hypothetical protein